jgi:hypothetical protein
LSTFFAPINVKLMWILMSIHHLCETFFRLSSQKSKIQEWIRVSKFVEKSIVKLNEFIKTNKINFLIHADMKI